MKEHQHLALFLPFLGGRGANRVLLNLANGFAAAGEKVDLLLAEAKGELLPDISYKVRLVDLRSPRGVLRSLPAARRFLAQERPDILLTAMDYVNVLFVLVRAISRSKTRLFVSCHNSLRHSVSNSPRFRERFLPALVRVSYRHADGVIAVSNGVADTIAEVAHIPRQKIDVIYNPVVTESFLKDAAAPVDHPWLVAQGTPTILGVGRLTAQKDFSTLIDAFALVNKRMPARLILLGEGEERAQLSELGRKLGLAERISMPGWVPNPLAYISKASVFVLSSRWEGFGLVLAEALACGTPVVSTDCESGPAEILEHGKYGPLVPIQDPESMSRAILRTLDAPPDAADLQRRGQQFSLDASVMQYLRIFRRSVR